MQKLSYRRHRFHPDIIKQAVWLYFRFTMSYRDVEDLLAERGIDGKRQRTETMALYRHQVDMIRTIAPDFRQAFTQELTGCDEL